MLPRRGVLLTKILKWKFSRNPITQDCGLPAKLMLPPGGDGPRQYLRPKCNLPLPAAFAVGEMG